MTNYQDTTTAEYKTELADVQNLIGYKAQSTILTGISENGQHSVMLPAQLITGGEVVFNFGQPMGMVTIDGYTVYISTLRNITK